MAEASPIITNWTAGEISPYLEGRPDLSKFHNSARICENLVVSPWGPLIRRPGTRFVVEVQNSAKATRVLPFEHSIEQAYVIEAGEFYFRFCKDRGQIVAEATDAAIANGTFTGAITSWSDISTGLGSITHDATNDRCNLIPGGAAATDIAIAEQAVAVSGGNQGNEHVISFEVFGAAGDRIEFQVGTATGGADVLTAVEKEVGTHTVAFTPGATTFYVQFRNLGSNLNKTLQIDNVALFATGAAIELVTPYAEADLVTIKHTQSADIFYLTAPGYAVRKLSRTGHPSWSLTELAFIDGPYLAENIETTTLQPSVVSGPGITITASAVKGINKNKGFLSTDVGRLIAIKHTNWGWARITGWTSATVVTADVGGAFDSATTSAAWRPGLYSDTTGHPKAVSFHEQRLCFAGSAERPARIDGSEAGEFETFTPGVDAGNPVAVSIDANAVPNVFWLASKDVLLAGAAGGEAKIGSDAADAPLSPTNIRAKYATNYRCKDLMPVIAPKSTLFLQRHGKKLHELVFDIDISNFSAPDMTILSEHITGGGIVDMAYAQEPLSIVWCCRADGQAPAFTYQRDEEVTGWHRHLLGGTDAKAESVTSIPGTGADEVWLVVSRTIDGGTKRYIEFIEDLFPLGGAVEDAFFVDCGLSYDGAPTSSISGLAHLEGETVRILADGAAQPDRTVSGGAITLAAAASKVHVGLANKWRLKPQRFEGGSETGSAQGKQQRTHMATLRVIDTAGVSAGKDENNLDLQQLRSTDDQMDSGPTLRTGEIVMDLNTDWDRDGGFLMQGDNAFPATIVSVVPYFDVSDG